MTIECEPSEILYSVGEEDDCQGEVTLYFGSPTHSVVVAKNPQQFVTEFMYAMEEITKEIVGIYLKSDQQPLS